MAQCYAESKPFGGTFDMYGGAFTGRLYCSDYASEKLKGYNKYSAPSTATVDRSDVSGWSRAADQIPPKINEEPKRQWGSRRILEEALEVHKPPFQPQQQQQQQLQQQQQQQQQQHLKSDENKLVDRMPTTLSTAHKSFSDEASKPPIRDGGIRKFSGEQKKVERDNAALGCLQKQNLSVEASNRSTCDVIDHSNSEKKASKSEEMLKSHQNSQEFEASNTAANMGYPRPGSLISHQSWPSSPANLRAAPRTRNLSEGSFSMMFPEDNYASISTTSPTKGKAKLAPKPLVMNNPFGHAKSKQSEATATTTTTTTTATATTAAAAERSRKTSTDACTATAYDGGAYKGGLKRGESNEIGGKARSYTGSPPRLSSDYKKASAFIRHSRNASDGNWAAINNVRGSKATNALVTPVKVVTKSADDGVKSSSNNTSTSSHSKVNDCGNGGFVTGGSFSRSCNSNSNGNNNSNSNNSTVESKATESVPSYGRGNVYLMGETMLLKKARVSSDADEVKNIGNDQFKKGNFMEALCLYNRAISLSSSNPIFYTNKAAALAALGKLPDAVDECQHALFLDPSFTRPHQRLASFFIRLGRIEDAKEHMKGAGEIDSAEIERMEMIELHLKKCRELRKLRDWDSVIKQSDFAVGSGADFAIEAFALKAEALLKLHRIEEAEKLLCWAMKLGTLAVKPKHFTHHNLVFTIQTQLHLAQGRFEEAVATAEKSTELGLIRRVRGIARARAKGNELFKVGKYSEACVAYGEGLELDPENAIFFCNRAACRSKLGLWEKAIEDCNAALSVQPSYLKALLRRADCNSQLERWEECCSDYEILKSKINGGDERKEIERKYDEAFKCRELEVAKMKFSGEIGEVFSYDDFNHSIRSPGLAVVQFITRWSEGCKQMAPFIHQLCKRYPSVNFFKVDVEEHPLLAKRESVGRVPTFKMYKNGHQLTQMLGPSQHKLECALQEYICI